MEQFPELPFGLWSILDKCLAKDPEERYASMAEFGAACRSLVEELAEDSQLMRIELRTALPQVRKAARKPGAPKKLRILQDEVESALAGGEESNYQSLNRLIAGLADQHRLLCPDSGSSPFAPPGPLVTVLSSEVPGDRARAGTLEASAGTSQVQGPNPAVYSDESDATRPATTERPGSPGLSIVQGVVSLGIEGGQKVGITRFEKREPEERRSSPGLQGKPYAQSPANPSLPAGTNGESQPAGARGKDRVSELLSEIDQGQESTRKTVEDFLRGRQARQSTNNENAMAPRPLQRASARTRKAPSPPGREAAEAAVAEEAGFAKGEAHPRLAGALKEFGLIVNRLAGMRTDISTALRHRETWSAAAWICAATGLLALAVAIPYWIQTHNNSLSGNALTSGMRPAAASSSPGSIPPPEATANAKQDRENSAHRGVLLEEAQALHAAGRLEESKVFLNRLLELDPGNQPALQERDAIEAESEASREQERTAQSVQKLLAGASSAIKAGNLQKANADLDKADQLQPGLADVATLRKRVQARKLELGRIPASGQEKQRELAQTHADAETRTAQAEELFRQGKYTEALTTLDGLPAQVEPSPQTQELRSRAAEMQHSLEVYEAALSAGKHSEALAALEKAERLNPTDPNLSTLRRRADTVAVSGSATLSVYPIGAAGTLMFDDKPIGANGEVIRQPVPVGRHRLTARNSQGLEVADYFDFHEGQEGSLIYDVARKLLRPASEADRDLISRNKARQQVYRLAVEHSHGLFRGSCKGDLIVSYDNVEYRPSTGYHGFRLPLKNLKLRIENRNAILLTAADDKEFMVFKIQDDETAEALKKMWDELAALDK